MRPLQSSDKTPRLVEVLLPAETDHAAPMPPKTPAADMFSPTASDASVARTDGHDTPPPSGLTSASCSTSSSLTGASRPSRRARAAVNYAEPNLISKMRRPTKELADAVALAARQSANDALDSNSKVFRTVMIKQEDGGYSQRNDVLAADAFEHIEAGSPSGGKRSKQDENASKSAAAETADTHSSASGRAIAALMANNAHTTIKRGADTRVEADKPADKDKMQGMDLYDFMDSSPRQMETEEEEANKAASRRHSSVGAPVKREVARRRASKEQPSLLAMENAGIDEQGSKRLDRVASRRRSMIR